jgi:hypothetical protein
MAAQIFQGRPKTRIVIGPHLHLLNQHRIAWSMAFLFRLDLQQPLILDLLAAWAACAYNELADVEGHALEFSSLLIVQNLLTPRNACTNSTRRQMSADVHCRYFKRTKEPKPFSRLSIVTYLQSKTTQRLSRYMKATWGHCLAKSFSCSLNRNWWVPGLIRPRTCS